MSFLEILHRITEQFKRLISRFYVPGYIYNFNSIEALPKLPGVNERLNNLISYKNLILDWKILANTATASQFQFLGLKWPENITNNIWHLDPVTNKQWPLNKYCFQTNYRNTNDFGDIKYVWEINRLQFLQPLAALAAIEKDENLSRYCLNTIEDWIDNNPPYMGINWISGIELACRTISIIIVISLIDDDFLMPQLKTKIQNSLALHGYWLMRYPSRYSSANNHLIAEAGALYLLGKLAPHMPNAHKWKKYGKTTLIKEISKQIYTDGVGSEQSPTYTAFSLEWFLTCGHIGNLLNDAFPKFYWNRIEKAGEFIRWLTDKNGNQPRIGDDDEGHVFYSHSGDNLYTTSILGTLTNIIQRHDIAPPVKTTHLREVFFGQSIYTKNTINGVKCFHSGGYTVSRSNTKNKEVILILDHGPLGYLSIAAHGHADSLAIWLHIEGIPIIVDAGTYLYHSGGNLREYMRSTPAHNTLSIAGLSSSKTASAFNWATKAKTSLLTYTENQDQWVLEAEHDGYQKQFGLRHRRRVERNNDTSFTIIDSLHGSIKELPIEIGYLFNPDLKIEKQNSYWQISQNNIPLLQIELTTNNLQQKIQYGETDPIRGWYSEVFGKKVKTSRLVFFKTISTDTTFNVTLRF